MGGSQSAFLLGRWAGRPVVERLAPTDVMNYVAGPSALSGRRFFVANLLGRLPGAVLMTAIGAYGFKLSGRVWLFILAASSLMFIAWRLGFARKRKVS